MLQVQKMSHWVKYKFDRCSKFLLSSVLVYKTTDMERVWICIKQQQQQINTAGKNMKNCESDMSIIIVCVK